MSGGDDVRGVGEPRPRGFDPDHSPRARRGRELRRHGRRLLERGVRGDRRQGAEGPSRPGRAGDEGALPDGRGPERARQLAPLDHPGVRGELAPARHRMDRPVPDPPLGPGDRSRRDARCAHRSGARGQGALHRLVDVSGERDRGGAVGGGVARPRALRLRAAAVLAARARDRGGGAARLREARDGRYLLGPARRRLADRRLAQGQGAACEHARGAPAAALRPLAAGEPAEAGGRRCARAAGRGSRA